MTVWSMTLWSMTLWSGSDQRCRFAFSLLHLALEAASGQVAARSPHACMPQLQGRLQLLPAPLRLMPVLPKQVNRAFPRICGVASLHTQGRSTSQGQALRGHVDGRQQLATGPDGPPKLCPGPSQSHSSLHLSTDHAKHCHIPG
jgi:hypothetical protein